MDGWMDGWMDAVKRVDSMTWRIKMPAACPPIGPPAQAAPGRQAAGGGAGERGVCVCA